MTAPSVDTLLLQLIEHRGYCTRQSLKSLVSGRWVRGAGTPEEILERLTARGDLVVSPLNRHHYLRPHQIPGTIPAATLTPPPETPRVARPKRGRPPFAHLQRRARADAIVAALPDEGSVTSAELARAIGLHPSKKPYKEAIALLLAEGRIERPLAGHYAAPGRGDPNTGWRSRILHALAGQGAVSLDDLAQTLEAAYPGLLTQPLRQLRASGQVVSPRRGLYALSESTELDDRGRGACEKLRAVLSDGREHRTRDLVAALCDHVKPATARAKLQVLRRNGEIVNTARGTWRINDGQARPRAPQAPAQARMRRTIEAIPGDWSPAELQARMIRTGDLIPIRTLRTNLYRLLDSGDVLRTAYGRYARATEGADPTAADRP